MNDTAILGLVTMYVIYEMESKKQLLTFTFVLN